MAVLIGSLCVAMRLLPRSQCIMALLKLSPELSMRPNIFIHPQCGNALMHMQDLGAFTEVFSFFITHANVLPAVFLFSG